MNLNNIDRSKLPADVRKELLKLQVMVAEKKIKNKENSHIEIMSKIASLALDEKIRKKWKNSKAISEIENTSYR